MRTKLWSTLFALVLLGACVAGVLLLGVQAAEGTTYQWVVNGETTDTTNSNPNEWTFVSIDEAIQYAKSQTAFAWEKDDQLIVHIAATDTAAATANGTSRFLFAVTPIFRADNTLLPITIDGDDPDTATVERNGFSLNGTGYNDHGINCGNSYYFKGMDLDWGSVNTCFRAGCGQVTFDDVSFGTGRNLKLSADATSSAIFSAWNADKIAAMGSNGIYDITLTLKNITYDGSATNIVSARNWNAGFSGNLPIGSTNSKLIIGENCTLTSVCCLGLSANISDTNKSNSYIVDIQGSGTTISTYWGVRASYSAYGDIFTSVSNGTITTFYGGSNTGTLNGNVTNTVKGGTIKSYFGGAMGSDTSGSTAGIINGNVTNYFGSAGQSTTFAFPGFVGGNRYSGSVNGTIENHIYNIKPSGTYYCGMRMGSVDAVKNYFYDGFDGSGVTDAYCGNNSATRDGQIKNNITNIFYGGKFGSYLHCGSSSANFTTPVSTIDARIINDVRGGEFLRLICASGGKDITDYKIQNTFSGKVSIGTFIVCGGNTNKVGTVENTFKGEINGGVVYCGSLAADTATIKNELESTASLSSFYGGNKESGAVTLITNTFNGGTFSDTVYGGSANGTVGTITNTVNSGSFDGTYFVCGNNKATFATATGDTADTVRIKNDINGGTFNRIVGGSYNADVNGSIKSDYDTGIVARVAVYAGNASGGDIIGTVTNNIDGTVPNDGKATIRVFYGGNNNGGGTIGAIVNHFKGGALRSVYGGCNYEGVPASITNTVTGGVFGCEYALEEVEEVVYFCGGNRVTDLASDVTTTLKSGTFVNVYAGTLLGNDSGNVKLILAPEGALTVLGKAFGITGVTSNADAPIFIGRDSYLSVAVPDASNRIYVCQTEGWNADRYVSVKGELNTIGWKNADGVTGTPAEKIVGGNTVLYYGNAASVDSVSLILTDRISIKVYFAKALVGDDFTYSFKGLRGDVLVSGIKANLTEEGEYYYAILPAIGLAEFEKPFLLCGNGLETCEMSIVELADLGAAYYETKDTKSANLFKSIADLGRSANAGDPRYKMTPETVTYTPAEATVKAGIDVLDVQSMTLVMSNAVGISFKGEAAAADTVLEVFVNGKKVTELCTVTVAQEKNANAKYDVSVDLYLNVASMSKELKIELKSGDESTTYLAMYTRADAIAQTIANKLPEKKDLAEDLLVYIQAVDAYKA